MDWIDLLERFGIPLVVAGLFWIFIQKQNKYIQDDLTKDLHNKFNRLEQIINDDLRNITSRFEKHFAGIDGLRKKLEEAMNYTLDFGKSARSIKNTLENIKDPDLVEETKTGEGDAKKEKTNNEGNGKRSVKSDKRSSDDKTSSNES